MSPRSRSALLPALLCLSLMGPAAQAQTPVETTPVPTPVVPATPLPAAAPPAEAPPPLPPAALPAPPADTPPATDLTVYAQSPAAMAFADDLARRRGLDPQWVREQIGAARRQPAVIRLSLPAPRAAFKNWAAYRARFVEPMRIRAGQRFWDTHRTALERAEREFGVPASLIVGVIGVETLYGQHTGNFRVIDALTTLAFDFPASHPRAEARAEFFRGELEQFLSLAQRTGMDPQVMRGSYAGAMGWPQFMPSSWARFAIDFDGDGKIDLLNSPVDAIGSVANYFKAYGWQPGQPTHYAVGFDLNTLDKEALLAPDILPSFSAESFAAKGAVLDAEGKRHIGKLALIELQNGDPANGGTAPTYLAGTDNFYTVTRYNWSSYYALAVIELGQAVQAQVPVR
ncbi:lytic murein transglycosylase B [Hydrogenophaga pseudoflava]|uniref:lytic murein transglycosylase B n=1 Tax=Hydrogenophaga pseudoflava TaxID=47421 RepID=UPI0027E580C1|nr:lytic murein transglycosylase B [Hydrogenophaga pseudoflava]MDQ7742824.1 lytic murein transglycosylase B [Hydrogenophaga pseudoflava]